MIFDDTPNVKWNASVIETIDYKKPEKLRTQRSFRVSFKVRAALVFDIFDGPILDSQNIKLDDEIPIGPNEYYTITTAGDSTIHNTGDRPVRPVLRVTNVTKPTTITCNGISIRCLKTALLTATSSR